MKQKIDAILPDSQNQMQHICIYSNTNASFPSKKHNTTFFWFSLNPEWPSFIATVHVHISLYFYVSFLIIDV